MSICVIMNLWKEKLTMCCSEHWSDPCAEHCRATCRCESHLPKIDFSFCPNSKMCEMLRSVLVPSASTKSSTTAFMWTTCPMPIYQGLLVPITIMTILQYFQYFPSRHFRRTTDFIQRAVETGGTVCVNCYMGLSRLVFHILVVRGNVGQKSQLSPSGQLQLWSPTSWWSRIWLASRLLLFTTSVDKKSNNKKESEKYLQDIQIKLSSILAVRFFPISSKQMFSVFCCNFSWYSILRQALDIISQGRKVCITFLNKTILTRS